MTGDGVALLLAVLAPLASAGGAWLFFRRYGGGPEVSWPKLAVGNALVFLCITSFLFLGFESYFRFCYDTTDGDAGSKISRRWFERHWSVNSMQIRDNVEYPLARSPQERRITFLGDSFTAGHGVADVETRFVNRLRVARPAWEVHGMAVLGASTESQLLALDRLVMAGYELDVVVLAYVFNDLEPYVPEIAPVYERMSAPPPALAAPLVEHSYALNVAFHIWRAWESASGVREDDYFAILEHAYSGEPWQRERASLQKLVAMVQGEGGRFLAVTFPMLVHLGRGQSEGHVMHGKLQMLWDELGVPHLDLLPVFEEHRGPQLVVSRYDDHPSAYAHGLAAEAMLRFLEENVR